MAYPSTPMPTSGRTLRRPSGFTLIELLVVVGIVGVLAAILLPTIGTVREQSRRAKCASNIRQCVAAVTLQAIQNKGNLPSGIRNTAEGHPPWISSAMYKAIIVNVGSPKVMACPNWAAAEFPLNLFGEEPQNGNPADGPWTAAAGYLMSYFYLGGHRPPTVVPGAPQWVSPQRITDRGDLPVWADQTNRVSNPNHGLLYNVGPHGVRGFAHGTPDQDAKSYGLRGANVGYLDGSVRWKSVDDLTQYNCYYQVSGNTTVPGYGYDGYW